MIVIAIIGHLVVDNAAILTTMARIGSKEDTKSWNEVYHQFGESRRDLIPENEIKIETAKKTKIDPIAIANTVIIIITIKIDTGITNQRRHHLATRTLKDITANIKHQLEDDHRRRHRRHLPPRPRQKPRDRRVHYRRRRQNHHQGIKLAGVVSRMTML